MDEAAPAQGKEQAPPAAADGPKKAKKPRKKPAKKTDGAPAAPKAEKEAKAPVEKKDSKAEKPKAAQKEPKAEKPKAAPRKKRDPSGPLSETMLFVGNLPFVVEDEDLKGIFDSDQVVSARVVKFGKRSKGFGFVEFKTNQALKAALEEYDGATLEGRELILKQAYAEDKPAE